MDHRRPTDDVTAGRPPPDRAARLGRYRSAFAALESALAGASEADIDRRPADGGWTAREVVHHVADMETHGYIRLRRLLTEPRAELHVPDEPAYARRLHYDRPIGPSLAVVRAVRDASLQLLAVPTQEEWSRCGWHPRLGQYDVDRWLSIYSEHPHEHAAQIRAAIGRMADGGAGRVGE